MRLLLFVSLVATLLSGCETVRYELRPPATETGRLCVTQCGGTREICRGNELRRAQEDKRDCERQSDSDYHACMRRADSPETRRNCNNKKRHCSAYENYDRCEEDYRACYAQCGGVVTKIVEKY